MSPLRPTDIFLIQAAIKDYKRKHPREATPSAEVALAWQADRRAKRTNKRPEPRAAEPRLLFRILNNIRFLFKPLGSV